MNHFPQVMSDGFIAKSELQAMKHQSGWVFWPKLPVKRVDDNDDFGWEMGIVLSTEPSTVYKGNIFMGLDKPERKYMYSTIEDMITDGWFGD